MGTKQQIGFDDSEVVSTAQWPDRHQTLELCLRLACFTVFFGRAWQHIIWDAPYRELLWDQALLQEVVQSVLGMTWNDYVTSPYYNSLIQGLIRSTGIFYLLCGAVALAPTKVLKRLRILLLLGSLSLFSLALLYWKERFYQGGQFVEYSAQFMSPVFLYLFLSTKINLKHLELGLKIAIALTFAGHGLYAFGYYPTPGPFIDMTINMLGVSEDNARLFLKTVGALDFILAVLIFVPKTARFFLLYAAFWGLATAFARPSANFDIDMLGVSLNMWLPEMLYRLCHALIPLSAWLVVEIRSRQDKVKQA